MADRDALDEINRLLDSATRLNQDVANTQKALYMAEETACTTQNDIKRTSGQISNDCVSLNRESETTAKQCQQFQNQLHDIQNMQHSSDDHTSLFSDSIDASTKKRYESLFNYQNVSQFQNIRIPEAKDIKLPSHLKSPLSQQWIDEKKSMDQIEKTDNNQQSFQNQYEKISQQPLFRDKEQER